MEIPKMHEDSHIVVTWPSGEVIEYDNMMSFITELKNHVKAALPVNVKVDGGDGPEYKIDLILNTGPIISTNHTSSRASHF